MAHSLHPTRRNTSLTRCKSAHNLIITKPIRCKKNYRMLLFCKKSLLLHHEQKPFKHLITKNLSIGYFRGRKKIILHSNINVCMEEGEFACILGPNGAGKSTLLKTIVGFIPKISGEILLNNEDLCAMSELEKAKKVSIVLTERPVVADMTVFELVALGRSPFTNFFGKIEEKDEILIEKAIQDVGLKGFESRLVGKLSDGECQKAFIAKSLVQETPLLLFDEPTAFLDLPSRIETMHLLKDLAKNHNKIVLLSTHDLELALQTADKIWLMAAGLPLKTGTIEDLTYDDFNKYFEKEGAFFDYTSKYFNDLVGQIKDKKLQKLTK